MKLHFLGTGAFEGIPALFCDCEICQQSRSLGGKNIRKRTSVLVDDSLLIDFPTDMLTYVHTYGLELWNLKHLVVTHSHSDHYHYQGLEAKLCWYVNPGNPPLTLHASESCLDMLTRQASGWPTLEGYLSLDVLRPFETVTIDSFQLTPLPASHKTELSGETAFVFLLEKERSRIVYGTDSAPFSDEVVEFLGGKELTGVILDSTDGNRSHGSKSHMGLDDNCALLNRLRSVRAVTEKTICIAHHFSHNGKIVYDIDAPKYFEHGILMAYDGMITEV